MEPSPKRLVVVFGGLTIADSTRALKVMETASPPTFYVPRDDVLMEALRPGDGRTTFCEWKGQATYFDIHAGGRLAREAAWTYPAPRSAFAALEGHIAFYPGRVDDAFLDGERVRPQPGAFYGGWITDDIVGPFKGESDSAAW
jgi:uncharacterized protein (DUF427 family)